MKNLHLVLTGSTFAVLLGFASPLLVLAEEGTGKASPKRGRPDGAAPDGGPRRGPRDGAGGMPSMEERLKMMTERLGLNSEQQGRVRSILEKNGPELKALFEKGRENATEADKEKFRSLMKGQMDEIAAVLNPDQREKFKEAMKNRVEGRGGEKPPGSPGSLAEGGAGRMEERLAVMKEKLGLTPEQQQKVRAVFEKNAGKMREAFSAGGDKVREAMRAQMEEVGALLTPEQREKMREMSPKGDGPRGGKGKPE